MSKKYIICLFLLLITSLLQAQVLLEEDFESGNIPDGWTVVSAATDGGWDVGTPDALSSEFFEILDNGSSYVLGTNDDLCNCDKSNEQIITPAIDLSAFDGAILEFNSFFLDNSYQEAQEDAVIEVSIDGENWDLGIDLHGHGSWDRHFLNLKDYVGNETVYIRWRYEDGGGWLYGFAIDDVRVVVPPSFEVELIEMQVRAFGEVGTGLPIEAMVFNGGSTDINSIELRYSIDGGAAFTEVLEDVEIASIEFADVAFTSPWIPEVAGIYEIEMEILAINGETDETPENNIASVQSEIFELVVAPNKIEDYLNSNPILTEIEGASGLLDSPTDLDFFPINGKNQLWVINQRTEDEGGSTLRIDDATNIVAVDFLQQVDGNAWHFMSLPTGIAFSDDNFNFASSPGVQDANHSGDTFTGPTLWSSDPNIYAMPSGGNGSHLDMLHGSPYSMGIAHEIDNVFWVYDNWNKEIVRYDFVKDHGPGNDDHSDGTVRRYRDLGITADGDIPNHLIMDKQSGWLYFVDNGNSRVMRLDINSEAEIEELEELNEPLAEHSAITSFSHEVIIEDGLDQPCGIEIFEDRLLVGDYANGDIVIYDMADFTELGRVQTEEPGLTGIKIGPDGNIWYTNRSTNKLMKAEPGELIIGVDVENPGSESGLNVSPNPSTGIFNLRLSKVADMQNVVISIDSPAGQNLMKRQVDGQQLELDLSGFPEGLYFLSLNGPQTNISEKLMLRR